MKPSRAFYALLWKESRVVMPLAIGISLLASVIFGITYFFVSGFFVSGVQSSTYISILILFPNLVAFGVSALQVGHEDEVGTLQWQRSLPVGVSQIFFSKLVVGLAAVVGVWIICLLACLLVLATGNLAPLGFFWSGTSPIFELELARLAAFTLSLLASSVFSSWLLRSPTGGLLLSAAIIVGLTFAINVLIDPTVRSMGDTFNPHEQEAVWGIVYSVLVSFVLLCASWGLARRRWAASALFATRGRNDSDSYAAYQPQRPLQVAAPGLRYALIWQSVKQARGQYLAAFGLFGLWIITRLLGMQIQRDEGYPSLLLIALGCLLGVTTFNGDSVRQRYRFLSERGVSAWTLWWTRALVPAFVLLVLLGSAALLHETILWFRDAYPQNFSFTVILASIAGFLLGAIASQWTMRPTVGLLAAPLLVLLACIYCGFVFTVYPGYEVTIVTGLAVLLACGLRMTGRWSESRRGYGYYGRFVGWCGLAAFAVIMPIAAHRWWTTPSLMQDWRVATFAEASKLQFEPLDTEWPNIVSLRLSYVDSGTYVLSGDSREQLEQAIQRAKDGEVSLLDHHGAIRSLQWLFSTQDGTATTFYEENELTHDDVMLLATQGIEYLSGKPLSLLMSDYLDMLELVVAQSLLNPELQKMLGEQQVKRYAGRLRTPERRREDRRKSLLLSWAAHSSSANRNFMPVAGGLLRDEIPGIRGPLLPLDDAEMVARAFSFAGYHANSTPKAMLRFERIRNLRLIDKAVQLGLQQASSHGWPQRPTFMGPLSVLRPSKASRQAVLWSEIFDRRHGFWQLTFYPEPTMQAWYEDFELQIEWARALAEP